jgi:hypothetical protein
MNCSFKRSSSTKRKLTEIILKIELLHKRAAPQGNSNRDYTEIELLHKRTAPQNSNSYTENRTAPQRLHRGKL